MSETLTLAWPEKEGEFHNMVMDSTLWNGFAIRDDDVIVATHPKSGTTLTQQIMVQIILGPDESLSGASPFVSPWVDLHHMPARAIAEAQTHRRILKTHLARQHLPLSRKARYVVVGRDVRDVAWSFHNHLNGFMPAIRGQIDNDDYPYTVTDDLRGFYHAFLDGPAQTQPFWLFTQGWWDVRHLPNVLLIHYADLIGDMPGQIRRLADFVDVPLDDTRLAAILPLCGIDYMRVAAIEDGAFEPMFKDGARTFFNKGTNGRWRDVLTQAEIDKADVIAARELTPDCAAWLRTGGVAA